MGQTPLSNSQDNVSRHFSEILEIKGVLYLPDERVNEIFDLYHPLLDSQNVPYKGPTKLQPTKCTSGVLSL